MDNQKLSGQFRDYLDNPEIIQKSKDCLDKPESIQIIHGLDHFYTFFLFWPILCPFAKNTRNCVGFSKKHPNLSRLSPLIKKVFVWKNLATQKVFAFSDSEKRTQFSTTKYKSQSLKVKIVKSLMVKPYSFWANQFLITKDSGLKHDICTLY